VSEKRLTGDDKIHTRKAISTFSFGMLVHVKCMHVSIPMRLWQVLTISDVNSDVLPPAFLSCRHDETYDLRGDRRLAKLCL